MSKLSVASFCKGFLFVLIFVYLNPTFRAKAFVPCPQFNSPNQSLYQPDQQELLTQVHLYRNRNKKDISSLQERTGAYSALGVAIAGGGKAIGSATLFHNCLALVSRHLLDYGSIQLQFGIATESGLSIKVDALVKEMPEISESHFMTNREARSAADMVVVEIPQAQCAKVSALTPARVYGKSANSFAIEAYENEQMIMASTRSKDTLDDVALGLDDKMSKSIVEKCFVTPPFRPGHSKDGAIFYHNCSSVNGSSGGILGFLKRDSNGNEYLEVGAINQGSISLEGVPNHPNILQRRNGMGVIRRESSKDANLDPTNEILAFNVAATLDSLSAETRALMSGSR